MRTPRYTVEQVAEALRLSAGIQSLAAKRLKCDRKTVSNYIKAHPSLAALIEEIVEESLDLAEGQLLKSIGEGDKTAIIFYLKTKGKQRGYIERGELTGKDGGAVAIKQEDIDAGREKLISAFAVLSQGKNGKRDPASC